MLWYSGKEGILVTGKNSLPVSPKATQGIKSIHNSSFLANLDDDQRDYLEYI